MMEVRAFEFGRDYPEICEWWRAGGWSYVPKSALSQIGSIVEEGDLKIAAAWLYITGSGLCQLEWLVTNPEAKPKQRVKAIKKCIKSLGKLGKAGGAELVFTSLNNDALIRIYQKCGFGITEKNMTNLIWRL